MDSNGWLDNDMDETFKFSAEAYKPSFDPSAWTKMERKLNYYHNFKQWHDGSLYGSLTILFILFLNITLLNPQHLSDNKDALVLITENKEEEKKKIKKTPLMLV